MTPRTLQPVHIFCVAVALLGMALLAALPALGQLDLHRLATGEFVVLAPSVILGELFPLELPRRSGDGEVTVSTMFSFALLLALGFVPALAAQLLASILQDGAARKPWWQIGFNLGQYTLSLGAAAGVLALVVGHTPVMGGVFGVLDLAAVAAAAAAFFLVNLFLVTRATTLYQRIPFVPALRGDIVFGFSVCAVLLCLAPVVVTVLGSSPVLFPLVAVPLLAVYTAGKQTVRTAKAEHLATHDSLTDLPNRRWFRDEVERALGRDSLSLGALLLVDLNRFKEVNDTLGHHHGDLVLRQIGPRLRAAFRDADLVARLGGDEFAVFMPGADSTAVHNAVAELQNLLHQPVEADGISIELDASVGLAWYPAHGSDVDTLLQRADVAMYRAKETQRSLVTYRAEDDYHSPARLSLVADLRRAMAEDRLVLHYQPQVDLGLGVPVAAEGLVRWDHPRRGLLSPVEFIEVAEHTGLIKDLTHRVIDLGLGDLRRWEESGRRLSLSLNVSARSLLDRNFPEEVHRLLAAHGVDGSALTLELTERSLMMDPEIAKRTMQSLSELGVSFAIDDFGIGYSSLAYLTDLPMRELKIDKSFVLAMNDDSRHAIIVKSTIDLARNLGLRTVAEGIEDAYALDRMRALGCQLAQGYHLSRALPPRELARWWDAHTAGVRASHSQPSVVSAPFHMPRVRVA